MLTYMEPRLIIIHMGGATWRMQLNDPPCVFV